MELLLQKEVGIKIESVIDPGSFWVRPKGAISALEISKHLKQEEQLGCSNLKNRVPDLKELVRVIGANGEYYRGMVMRTDGDDNDVTVFLIDTGQERKISKSSLGKLPRLWKDLKPQAALVGLYGLVPKNISWGIINKHKELSKKLSYWESSKVRVEEVVAKSVGVTFCIKSVIDGVPFGSIALNICGVLQDLASILVQSKIGKLSYDFESDLVILKHCRLNYAAQGNLRTDIGLPTSLGKKITAKKNEKISCREEHLEYINKFCRGELRPCYKPVKKESGAPARNPPKIEMEEQPDSKFRSDNAPEARAMGRGHKLFAMMEDKLAGGEGGEKPKVTENAASENLGQKKKRKKHPGRNAAERRKSRGSRKAYESETRDEAADQFPVSGKGKTPSYNKSVERETPVAKSVSWSQVLDISENRKEEKKGDGKKKETNIYGKGQKKEVVRGQYSDAEDDSRMNGFGRGWKPNRSRHNSEKKQSVDKAGSSELKQNVSNESLLDPSVEEMKIGFGAKGKSQTRSKKKEDKGVVKLESCFDSEDNIGNIMKDEVKSPWKVEKLNSGKKSPMSKMDNKFTTPGIGRGFVINNSPIKTPKTPENDELEEENRHSSGGLGRGKIIFSQLDLSENKIHMPHPSDREIDEKNNSSHEAAETPIREVHLGRGKKLLMLQGETMSDNESEASRKYGRGSKMQEKPKEISAIGIGRGHKFGLPSGNIIKQEESRESIEENKKERPGFGRGKKLLEVLTEHETKLGYPTSSFIDLNEDTKNEERNTEGETGDCRVEDRVYEELEVKYLTPEFIGGIPAGEEDTDSELSSAPSLPETKTQEMDPLDLTIDLLNNTITDCTVGRMLERMKMSGGLLHGDINIRPLSSIYDIQLHPLVIDSIEKKRIKDLTRCQMYIVPVIVQRRSAVLIGPPNSGKSLSYVIPLLSLLLTNTIYSELKEGNGPRCVFVVANAGSVRYIARLCSAVSAARLQIITTYGGGLELERKDELTNGCDVLITTPRCWLRLLKQKWVTNLARLSHLVLDESDTLFKLFMPEVKEILSLVGRLREVRKAAGVQVIIVGETWSSPVEAAMLNMLEKPVLCITAHLEAALYAKIKPLVLFMQPQNKQSKLLEIIESYKDMKSVVACNTSEEVKNLRIALSIKCRNVLFAHEEMPPSLLTDVVSSWVSCRESPILVCSDEVLNDLGVTDANALLNYSLPQSKSMFSTRFSVIKDSFHDRILHPKAPEPDCKVHIFMDETNEEQFPEVVNFMSRLSTPIPQKIIDTVNKIKKQKEVRKADTSLCRNLLQFGYCWKEGRCKEQHMLNYQRDKPRGLPLSGFVKLKILHVANATHYCVRLLAYTESDLSASAWLKVPSKYTVIGLKMSNYYSNRENRRPFGRVRVGDVVGVEVETDSLFYRARVVDIVSRDDKCNPLNVKIIYIDEGGELIEKNIVDLLRLPSGLEELEGEAIDVYLARLVPVDLDPAWSYASTSAIRKAVALHDKPENFFVGKVMFCVSRSLVVDPLQCYQQLELNKCNIVHLSLRHYILKSKLAVHNPEHIVTLHTLAKEVGLQVPNIEVQGSSDNQLEYDDDDSNEPVQWAHISSQDEYTLVNVIYIETPSIFFLRITNFHGRLEELQKELTEEMNNQKKIVKSHCIKPGKICVAKCPESPYWNRAMVMDVIGEDEVQVFYVDHGDTGVLHPNELFRIPDKFIHKMPFQAIEADLVGIKPTDDDGWLPEATDVLHDFSSQSDKIWKNFYGKVCVVNDEAVVTGGRHYSVLLIDTTLEVDIVINKEMVYRGFANWDMSTCSHLASAPEGQPQIIKHPQGDKMKKEEDLLTEEDEAMLMLSREKLNEEGNTTDGVCTSFDEVLRRFESGDFEINIDIDDLYPNSSAYLKKMLPAIMPDGQEEKKVEHCRGAKEEYKVESGNEGDVSDLEQVLPSYCTPTVYWYQNNTHVHMKVDLPALHKYSLKWSFNFVCFGAVVEDKLYKFHIDFFGPVDPETLEHHPRGLSLDLKVEKVMKGHDWARLLYKKMKTPWVKMNPDHVKRDDEVTLVDNFYKRGIQGLKEGRRIESVETTAMCLSDQDSDASSDLVEFSDIPYDPYDPLS